MLTPLLLGLAGLLVGGEVLVRGATSLAARSGLSPLFIGLTVVALATSSPELIVSVEASLSYDNGIAFANVVGSNICNIGLILGLAALIRPLRSDRRLVRVEVPVMIGCSLLLMGAALDGRIARWEGAVLLILLLVSLTVAYGMAVREQSNAAAGKIPGSPQVVSGWKGSVLFVLGLAGLIVGGELFLKGSVELADALGLSPAAIGVTVVALGTSLPELATSVVAAYRRQGDIAVGNVVGSNIINILAVCGSAAVIRPMRLGNTGWLELGVMLGLALLLLGVMLKSSRIGRVPAAVLLASYAAFVWVSVAAP